MIIDDLWTCPLYTKNSLTDTHRKSFLIKTFLHFWPEIPLLFVLFWFSHLFAYFLSLTFCFFDFVFSLSLCPSLFSLLTVACCCLIWAFLTSLQDVFKEARSHDHAEVKSDMETHIRSRKLPLTRKIYAFYHAPIVKFWSNTVGRLQKRTYTRTQSSAHPSNRLLYGGLSG